MRRLRWCVTVVCALAVGSSVHAQLTTPRDSAAAVSPGAVADSGAEVSRSPFRTVSASTVDTLPSGFRPSKSAGLAMLYSALIPGAGQVYNHSYWKVPIILGFGIYFTSQWLDQNRRYAESRDKYKESLSLGPQGDPRELARREFYKDQRDMFTWYLAILYFVNIADAFVDASLYDFNVGSDLSIRLIPDGRPGVGLSINF